MCELTGEPIYKVIYHSPDDTPIDTGFYINEDMARSTIPSFISSIKQKYPNSADGKIYIIKWVLRPDLGPLKRHAEETNSYHLGLYMEKEIVYEYIW